MQSTKRMGVAKLMAALCCLVLPALSIAAQMPDAGSQREARPQSDALWLESLDLSRINQGWGEPHAGRSVEGNPIRIGGVTFAHGIGTHAHSELVVDLKSVAVTFSAWVGVDDEVTRGSGSLTFELYVDGKKVAHSGVLHGGEAPKRLEADLHGAKTLTLVVTDAGDGITYDHADWADALLTLAPNAHDKPEALGIGDGPPRLVIPKREERPAIHGARIVGATPGKPFLFRIPATGMGPLQFSANNLPAGVTLDPQTGILSGALAQAGTTDVALMVRGPKGRARRTLRIVCGANQLALTPPMGWNSWNVWAGAVNADRIRAAADNMIKSGLAAHGFQYINIDDCWEGGRSLEGEIQTNDRFGDMGALAFYVHSKGLKLGIYSSPGPKTCGGYDGSYQHEQQDATTYARWGIDYLKYDWCSYGDIEKSGTLAGYQKPYQVMQAALAASGRDIVYSLCQYGMGDVWKWGAAVGGNCWRTTGDITDTWGSLYSIYTSQDGHEKYAGPGHWNDPDMLIVGRVGWGNPHPSRLTPNEQITHISLWCLLSAPLLIGCDMSQLDPFTVALLSNDEVLAVDQDPLGQPAGRVWKEEAKEVWARPLADSTKAVGLVNGGALPVAIAVNWSDLGLKGRQQVRDLWLHRNVGRYGDRYTVEVPAHGTVLLKIGRPKRGKELP